VIARATEIVEPHEGEECTDALLVARRGDGTLEDACFADLGRLLHTGDLLVVNTSGTLPAAVPARLARSEERGAGAARLDAAAARLDRDDVELHLSTPVDGHEELAIGEVLWVVELRTSDRLPLRAPRIGTRLELPGGASAELLARYLGSSRLSVARLSLGEPVEAYLRGHGHPIRYSHTVGERPIEDYQTVFALDPGSAEMPSAARPFTPELVTELVARGVLIAPVTLHCGVSSLEAGENPYPERYRVAPETARLVNAVHDWGGRVIAVGTTVVRALETVAAPGGRVSPGDGLTNLTVTPERGLRTVDGLITGWHEPESSHLRLLEAAAGPSLLGRSYDAARARGYRFHEFGDSHLILP
jgi:S-adenosylmethionine:tRNA ribosyltransferase-isomerase